MNSRQEVNVKMVVLNTLNRLLMHHFLAFMNFLLTPCLDHYYSCGPAAYLAYGS